MKIDFLKFFYRNIEFLLFKLLKIWFYKKKSNSTNILFFNSGKIGDLIVSSIILENEEIFNPNIKIYFLMDHSYRELFFDYDGRINFIYFQPYKYKRSIFYKIQFLKKLNKLNLGESINLSAARGIINDEITLLSSANKIVAINNDLLYLGQYIGRRINKYYSEIIAQNEKNEYNKHFMLLNYYSKSVDGTFNFYNKRTFNLKNRNSAKLETLNSYLVIAPFSSERNRDLPESLLNDIIPKLNQNYKIVLLGSDDQKRELNLLSKKFKNCIVLVERMKLNEIPILIKNSKLFIGIDSGLSHIALKLNIKMLVLIGGGMFNRFFPYMESKTRRYIYYQTNCFNCNWQCIKKEKECIVNVSSSLIMDTINEII